MIFDTFGAQEAPSDEILWGCGTGRSMREKYGALGAASLGGSVFGVGDRGPGPSGATKNVPRRGGAGWVSSSELLYWAVVDPDRTRPPALLDLPEISYRPH